MSLYFITTEDEDVVKIGITYNDPEARLKQLQIGNAKRLKLLAVAERDDERDMQARFAAHRIRGEWFRLTEEIKAFIHDELPKLPPGVFNHKTGETEYIEDNHARARAAYYADRRSRRYSPEADARYLLGLSA